MSPRCFNIARYQGSVLLQYLANCVILTELTLVYFCGTLILVSILYSCAGQAGASGYIAVMALFGFPSATIKPTALVLNVFVSAIVSLRFFRAGHFSWRLLFPFAISSLPAAMLGGFISLPANIFNRLLGSLLLVAALPLVLGRVPEQDADSPPRWPVALLAGAAVGLLSGLTGVGGGILFTPLLIYCRWAPPRTAAAISAVFIFINSVSALIGHLGAARSLPPNLPLFTFAALFGGAIGSQLGSVHLSPVAIHRILGAILIVAGWKFVLG
jgi:uncharacterized membrane protein YfcA